MKVKIRAFTLIELLVVIAIIAILASILFPVFASARDSGRQTKCISNYKQATSALLSYSQDYNEKFVMTNYWPAVNNTVYDGNKVWVQLLQPYVKEWTIFRCPSDINATDQKMSFIDNDGRILAKNDAEKYYAWAIRTNLGFNHEYLSQLTFGLPPPGGFHGKVFPKRLSDVAKPSSTLMIADSVWDTNIATGDPKGGGNWEIEPPCRCYNSSPCNTGSANDSFLTPSGYNPYNWQGWGDNPQEWYYWGGAWPFHRKNFQSANGRRKTRGMITIGWVDGHVSVSPPEILEKGCSPINQSWTGVIDDNRFGEYIWDLR